MSNAFTLTFTFMYLVNIGTTIYTLLGISCIRECIFRQQENESNKCRAIQCILGPLCATYQQAVVWLSLALQIMVSYAYVMFSMMLWIFMSLCGSGNAVVNSFQGFLDTYHSRGGYQANSFSPVNWFMGLEMDKYCHASSELNASVKQVFIGCLLSVCSQTLMLMVVSEEKGRIEGTMAEMKPATGADKKGDKRRRRRREGSSYDSQSDSSSSDDSTPRMRTDPLMQYKSASYPMAGRNYKLPGGYDARSFK
jgi:hypothetical protein